jgi:hypothetical protein
MHLSLTGLEPSTKVGTSSTEERGDNWPDPRDRRLRERRQDGEDPTHDSANTITLPHTGLP